MALSKAQVDRLGERLKRDAHTEADLKLLDEYRSSFDEAYRAVIRQIGDRGESRSARMKTTPSIAEKLRRESIRLTQIQDIAGCRIIVANVVEQDIVVTSLATELPGSRIIDRREKPSWGYRAVHVVVDVNGKSVEIQVRTWLQALWAELSEKTSDIIDSAIKYGGGPEALRTELVKISERIAIYEINEGRLARLASKFSKAKSSSQYIPELINCFFREWNIAEQQNQFFSWLAEHYPALMQECMTPEQKERVFKDVDFQVPMVPEATRGDDARLQKELARFGFESLIVDIRGKLQTQFEELDEFFNHVIQYLKRKGPDK